MTCFVVQEIEPLTSCGAISNDRFYKFGRCLELTGFTILCSLRVVLITFVLISYLILLQPHASIEERILGQAKVVEAKKKEETTPDKPDQPEKDETEVEDETEIADDEDGTL